MIDDTMRSIDISFGYVEMKNQTKFPKEVKNWQKFCLVKPTEQELLSWPRYNETGVCMFTGMLTQIIDVDSKNWKREGNFNNIFLERLKFMSFFDKLVYYKTINNGLQLPYKCGKVEGNKKLAMVDGECIIETRGDGGLAVCPPSSGYEWLDGGEWEAVPVLSESERYELIEFCQDFNEEIEPDVLIHEGAVSTGLNIGKAGDDWASQNDFIDYIQSQGWKIDKVLSDGTTLLRRPGKEMGCSASWNFKGLGRFYCWSSSAGLPTEKLLKPL